MAKLGKMTLKGKSGKSYAFQVYPKGITFSETFGCVYYVSERVGSRSGNGAHRAIYIGQTSDYNARHQFSHTGHHKYGCFVRHNFNAVSVCVLDTETARQEAESDLIAALSPPCNAA